MRYLSGEKQKKVTKTKENNKASEVAIVNRVRKKSTRQRQQRERKRARERVRENKNGEKRKETGPHHTQELVLL